MELDVQVLVYNDSGMLVGKLGLANFFLCSSSW